MKSIEVEAQAKINLSLDIVGVRDDGYHLLRSVMQTINLTDRLNISVADGPSAIRLTADRPEIPLDSRNTCYRAAEQWLIRSGNNYSILIDIEKHIPSEAGLGGGSADAAAVLQALNKLTGYPLSSEELQAAAIHTGADVPFCLRGGTALCEGIGEIITPLKTMPARPVLLLKPAFGLSTPAVFNEADRLNCSTSLDHNRILDTITSGNWYELGLVSANRLEAAALHIRPELASYLQMMRNTDAEMVMMTGSGTCIYAVYSNEDRRESAAMSLSSFLSNGEQLIMTSIS